MTIRDYSVTIRDYSVTIRDYSETVRDYFVTILYHPGLFGLMNLGFHDHVCKVFCTPSGLSPQVLVIGKAMAGLPVLLTGSNLNHTDLTPTLGYQSNPQAYLMTGGRVIKCPSKRVLQ